MEITVNKNKNMALNKKIKKLVSEITGDKYIKVLKGRDLAKPSKAFLKDGYIFNYPRPKTKNSLPYWDSNPIILIVARQGPNKVLGLNMNHIPYTRAIQLAKQLARRAKNKKRAVKYSDIKAAIKAAKLPKAFYMVALKSYLLDRISGNVYALEMPDYVDALRKVPRSFKKMGVASAIRMNQAKVFKYMRDQKKGKK